MGAHLTPQSMEATVMGLTAITFSMAKIWSSYCGVLLLHRLGIRHSGIPAEAATLQSLWKMQLALACPLCHG